jgi:DNA helicase MCM8
MFGATPRSQQFGAATWNLYFPPSDEPLPSTTSSQIEDENAVGDPSHGLTRAEMLAKCDDLLGRTNLIRSSIRSPMDIIAANYTLRLPFSSLTPVVRNVFGTDCVPLFNDRFEVIQEADTNNRPALMLDCLAHVAHEELLNMCPPPGHVDPHHMRDRLRARRLHVRLYDNDKTPFFRTPLCDLKADKVGKLVCVKGAVIRASSPRVLVEDLPHMCPKCKGTFPVHLPDGKYKAPTECLSELGGGCRGAKNFLPMRAQARTRDFQKVTLQETPEAGQAHEELYGRVPRTIDVELFYELVDSCVPGDHVKVVGMVKSMEVQNEGGSGFGKGGSSKPKCMYLLYVEAFAVINDNEGGGRRDGHKQEAAAAAAQAASQATSQGQVGAEDGSGDGCGGGGGDGGGGCAGDGGDGREPCTALQPSQPSQLSQRAGGRPGGAGAVRASAAGFSVRDLQEISRLHARFGGEMFPVLAASMCPTIFGHEVVKAGLLLGLFGGAVRALSATGGTGAGEADPSLSKRADIHVLVVGDPGIGKSQMLTAAAKLAPRGVYVCGNTTTKTGLTVTVVKDPVTGDFALEAGALVMGDQGCCCIDEFDKMSGGEHQALLEAMEQQTISVAKAGIVCSLSARTAVLAAANPVSGHYNKLKTVCENLKLPANILSRFDLVFVLLDDPNEAYDKSLAMHVMGLHAGRAAAGARRMAADGGGRGRGRGGGGRGRGGGGGSGGGGGGGGGGGLFGGFGFGQQQQQQQQQDPFAGVDGYDQWVNGGADGPGLAKRLCDAAAKFARDNTLLTHTLLRKYIAYARAHVHPTLSPAARKRLGEFYLALREKQRGGDSVPITARQLESLIRLAEARARMDLREVVTDADAIDAIEVVKETILYDVLTDAVGSYDVAGGTGAPPQRGGGFAAPAGGGKKPSFGKVANDFSSFLMYDCDQRTSALYTVAELQEAFNRSGLPNPKNTFAEFAEAFNSAGYTLIQSVNGQRGWKVQGSGISMHGSQR